MVRDNLVTRLCSPQAVAGVPPPIVVFALVELRLYDPPLPSSTYDATIIARTTTLTVVKGNQFTRDSACTP